MTILLIRHGATAGNLEKRFIGVTDEPLCDAGISELKRCSYQPCKTVISSPLKRCVQTANVLFPQSKIEICDDFRECDFGEFEGKNHAELDGNPNYQAWIDQGGMGVFPNGDNVDCFIARCCQAFEDVTKKYADSEEIAFVIHGGTIMAILSQFSEPKRGFYDWLTPNAHGWKCEFDGHKIIGTEKI